MRIAQCRVLGVLGAICSILIASNAFAQAVASCSDPEGHGYYHHQSAVSKKESGFQQERIRGGLTTLQRLDNGEYDILIVDIRKRVISFRQDGGTVMLLRRGTSDATFLVVFPGMTIELYTFYADAAGSRRFDILQSKGGDGMPIHKSSVMTGICSEMNLLLIK